MTQERLDAITARCEDVRQHCLDYGATGNVWDLIDADIPDLLAEVERLRAEVERFRAKRNETIDAIENLMESCRACDMCALNESDDTCSDNGEGYCSPVWIGRKEG